MKSTDFLLVQLYKMFDQANTHLYHGQLSRPVITVQSNKVMKSDAVMGWFTTGKVWQSDNSDFHEINVSPEFLNRPVSEIFCTLLHEMAHLYCAENNIKDTSRQGRYHNKAFKNVAEEHGLTITYDGKIGWSLSELNESGERFFKSCKYDASVFRFHRVAQTDDKGPSKPKAPQFKYQCPECESVVTSKKEDLHLRCVDCDCLFESV